MLEAILRERCGLDPLQPLVAGVSGGPDSLCLLDILHRSGYTVIVAHFNHRMRPEAEMDADAVRELARQMGLTFVTASADVQAYANEQALSLEEAARLLRYHFLFETARRQGAQAVATGHTADDQVETVLMHFLRGAGLAGLKGMDYRTILPVFDKTIPLVRPLLSLWRADTEAYCQEHGLQPQVDATNADPAYFRNRLRHVLIPELQNYNPRFKEAVLRSTQALAGDYDLLQEIAAQAWKDVLAESGEGWFVFHEMRLVQHSSAMRRILIRQAAELLRPSQRDIGFDALERAATFVESKDIDRIDFINGMFLFREAGKIYLAAYEADLPSAQWPQFADSRLLDQPKTDLGNGWSLSIETLSLGTESRPLITEHWSLNTDPWSCWLDADRLGGGLSLRPPRRGDRLQPLGMEKGSLKLSDLFVNAKVPRRARRKWPLVCAGEVIAWVPGLRPAHQFRVTPETQRVLHLELKK